MPQDKKDTFPNQVFYGGQHQLRDWMSIIKQLKKRKKKAGA